MLVGFTYDLKDDYLARGYSPEEAAEFDRADTIEGIEAAIQSLGHRTDRIGGIRPLVERLVRGDRWDMVFNIAEGMHGAGREAQVPALLDAYRVPYTFSDPVILGLTLHKGLTKSVVRDRGIPTPRFYEVETVDDINRVDLEYPLFAKPVAEGTSKGITGMSLIERPDRLRSVCAWLLSRFGQPVLVEEYLPGREFTVGIVGTGSSARTLAAMEVATTEQAGEGFYSYDNKAEYQDRVVYRISDDSTARAACKTALAAWKVLGCRDGGRVDLRCDARGVPQFIEVNPLAGLNPTVGDLPILCRLSGLKYNELIRQILESASTRLPREVMPGPVYPRIKTPAIVAPEGIHIHT